MVKSLTLIHYRGRVCTYLDTAYFDRLTDALGEHLTSLHFTFRQLNFTSVDLEKVKGTKLPNLRELDVVFEFAIDREDHIDSDMFYKLTSTEVGTAFYKLVAQLETPLLQQLSITDQNAECWQKLTEDFIEDLLNSQTNSNLHKFEFTGFSNQSQLKASTLLSILGNLNVVGSAIFSNWQIYDYNKPTRNFASPASLKNARKLRKLRLQMCWLERNTLKTLLNALIKTDHFPNFKEIVLAQCSGFTKESLRGIYGMEFVRFEH
jgi:hypothetical protein